MGFKKIPLMRRMGGRGFILNEDRANGNISHTRMRRVVGNILRTPYYVDYPRHLSPESSVE